MCYVQLNVRCCWTVIGRNDYTQSPITTYLVMVRIPRYALGLLTHGLVW